jgi:hypothetical protein
MSDASEPQATRRPTGDAAVDRGHTDTGLDALADRGDTTPDARGESALGTGHGSGADTGAHDTSGLRAGETPGAPGSARHTPRARLLSHDESDKFALSLQHAVTGFVDAPRDSVEEADHVLEEIAERFTDAMTQRRRTLRMSWQSTEAGATDKPPATTDTEQLRLALRDYRELAERLLHV